MEKWAPVERRTSCFTWSSKNTSAMDVNLAKEYEKLGGFPGNIDWDTAQNMKDKGIKPKDAAKRMKMLY